MRAADRKRCGPGWLALWLTACAVVVHAADARRFRYRQAPAPLFELLAEVAAHHGVNVIQPQSVPAPGVMAGLNGEFGLHEALDTLLLPLAMTWRQQSDGSISIVPTGTPLRLQIGVIDVRAKRWVDAQGRVQSHAVAAPSPGTPPALLAERTAAGWSIAGPVLRALPGRDLDRWLAVSPNTYGQGSRISLRGIERDSFAAQTSSVRLDGVPLAAAVLDAGVPLPASLARIDYALGPQPDQPGVPGFAGALALHSSAPPPQAAGSLGYGIGSRAERRLDWQQSLDLAAAGAVQFVAVGRRRDGSVRHADGLPGARDRLGALRWWWEPEAVPELSLSVDLLALAARPADPRILPPLLGSADFLPAARLSSEPARRLSVDAEGGRLGAGWRASDWQFDLQHVDSRSAQRVREPARSGRLQQLDQGERSTVQQLAASWLGVEPWRMRIGLDHARRTADVRNTDVLPLAALFPATGLLAASPGSNRQLTTGTVQRIRSQGLQAWMGHEGPRWSLEFGAAWSAEHRTERTLLERTVSPGCQLLEPDGRPRDCRLELPDLSRDSLVRLSDQRLAPAATSLWRTPVGRIGLQWRRGHRSGGVRPFAGQVQPYQAERSDTWETSWRIVPRQGLEARLALFLNRWQDRQVQLLDPAQAGFAIVNAGRARARGGELTLAWSLPDDWTLSLGLGALSTRFESFRLPGAAAPVDLAGRRFPGAPARSAVLGLTRSPQQGWELGLLWSAQSAAEGDAYNRAAARLAGGTTLDLRAGWRGRHAGVSVELLNVADRNRPEQILLSLVDDAPRSFVYNTPRQWRTQVEWRW